MLKAELMKEQPGAPCLGNDVGMCSTSSTATPRQVEVKFTKFSIVGIPGEKHAVFLPDGLRLTPALLKQVCGALGREMPGSLLAGLGGLRHPARLSSRQLRECAGFRDLMEEARCSLGLQQPGESASLLEACSPRRHMEGSEEIRPGEMEATGRCLEDVANRVLERKAASAVGNIAAAAYRSNAWILSGPQISSFEVLLQQCGESGRAGAFRLVVGHLQDRAYMESPAAKALLQRLFGASLAMSARAVQRASPIMLPGDMWDPRRNTSHPEFGRYGYDYWTFATYEDKLSESHPITQWPWPHGDLFLLFYREEVPCSSTQPHVNWNYMTRVRNDPDAIPFDGAVLAPVAHVCIGGSEPCAKKNLLALIKNHRPVIILDNTPTIPKQMSLLVTAIRRAFLASPLIACRPFLADGTLTRLWGNISAKDLLQALSPSKLLQHVEHEFDCSGVSEDERLSLSDVVGLLDLAQRQPQAFYESASILDPLRCSAEDAASQTADILSLRPGGTTEASTNTEQHRSVVLKAWRLHHKLSHRSGRLRSLATMLVLSIASCWLLATILAVAFVALRHQRADFEDVDYHVAAVFMHQKLEVAYTWSEATLMLNCLLVILPLLVGSLLLVQAHFRAAQRWADAHMLESALISELHHFLCALGPYAAHPAVAQHRFERRIEDLSQRLALVGQEERVTPASEGGEEDFPCSPAVLEEHVDRRLYGHRPHLLPLPWRRAGPGACPASVRSLACGGGPSEPKDLTAALSAEHYAEVRVLPLRRHYAERARGLARCRGLLQAALALCLAAASGLGAAGRFTWVPAPLAAAAWLAAVVQWVAPQELLSAVVGALAVLDTLDLSWHGADIRENRSEASKRRLVASTERAAWVVAAVATGAMAAGGEGLEAEGRCGGGALGDPGSSAEKSASRSAVSGETLC